MAFYRHPIGILRALYGHSTTLQWHYPGTTPAFYRHYTRIALYGHYIHGTGTTLAEYGHGTGIMRRIIPALHGPALFIPALYLQYTGAIPAFYQHYSGVIPASYIYLHASLCPQCIRNVVCAHHTGMRPHYARIIRTFS